MSKVAIELSYEQNEKESKAEAIKAAHTLQKNICGNLYDCDADWCPLEVLVGLSGLEGNRCHIQRLLDDLEKK